MRMGRCGWRGQHLPACPRRESATSDPVPGRKSRPSFIFKAADRVLRSLGFVFGLKHEGFELPFTPPFMQKHEGLVLSLGQFNQWVSDQVAASGVVQIWPGMPVAEPLDRKSTR